MPHPKRLNKTTDTLEKNKLHSRVSQPITECGHLYMGTSSPHTREEVLFPKSSRVLQDNELMLSVGGASCLPNQVNDEEDGNVFQVPIQVHLHNVDFTKNPQTSNKSVNTRKCRADSVQIESLQCSENNIENADKISVLQDSISTISSKNNEPTTTEKIGKNMHSYKSTKEHRSIVKALVISGCYLSVLLILGIGVLQTVF